MAPAIRPCGAIDGGGVITPLAGRPGHLIKRQGTLTLSGARKPGTISFSAGGLVLAPVSGATRTYPAPYPQRRDPKNDQGTVVLSAAISSFGPDHGQSRQLTFSIRPDGGSSNARRSARQVNANVPARTRSPSRLRSMRRHFESNGGDPQLFRRRHLTGAAEIRDTVGR